MIQLAKEPEPEVLTQHRQAWTEEYVKLRKGDPDVPAAAAKRYAHPDIRATLRIEAKSKCAYCESRILHVSPDHIEHLVPKSVRPDLVVTWTNLTLSCPLCNMNKGEYFEPKEPLLHPYNDDPTEHLLFVGPVVLQRPGSDVGLRSIEVLGLSRAGLIEMRHERLKRLHPLVDAWARASGQTQVALERQVSREAADEAEFAAAVRSYLLHVGFPLT